MNFESVRSKIIKHLAERGVQLEIAISDDQIEFWARQGQCIGQMAMIALSDDMEARRNNG